MIPPLRGSSANDVKLAEALAQVNWRDPGMDDLSRLFGCLLFGGSAKVPFGAKTGKIPTKAMATGPCAPFMDDLDALMERSSWPARRRWPWRRRNARWRCTGSGMPSRRA